MQSSATTSRKEAVQEWWKATLDFAVEQWSLVVVAMAAFAFFVLGLIGPDWLDERGLTSATLGLLTAVTLALAKERAARATLMTTTEKLVDSLQETNTAIQALRSPWPFHVQRHEASWDLDSGGGATAVKEKTLRFEQPDVYTARNWSLPDGKEAERIYEFDGVVVEPFATITVPGGVKTHDLVYLGKLCHRGDLGKWVVRRMLVDSFNEPNEFVSIDIEYPTAVVRLKVSWPPNRPPSKVCFVVWKGAQRQSETNVTHLVRTAGGRRTIDYEVVQPELNSVVGLTWAW